MSLLRLQTDYPTTHAAWKRRRIPDGFPHERLNPVTGPADIYDVNKGRLGIVRGVVAASVAGLVALGAMPLPATATDIESIRARAQGLGDEVSGLEARLADLNREKAVLTEEISAASAQLGVLEAEVTDARHAHEAALDEYVQRAIQAYKSGPSAELELLLSATTLDQLAAAAEVSAYSARRDGRAVTQLEAASQTMARWQSRIDERKQRMLAEQAKVDEVAREIERRIAARRAAMRELSAQITQLERQARAAAAQSANPGQALLDLLQPSGPSAGIPDGFAGTGVTFEGIASWYGPGFEGNPTANGDIFDPDLFTAASKELPLGSWLFVEHDGRSVVVLVNDRGPYIDGRVLDLSQAAAEAIGITGLGWIRAEVLVKT
ncbi:MAG: septal ring lytic transglycosylase RlpA family protein [Actinomycetota bacterium]|nr:septal ring lytic transglycosylase RlpA family protein [Actinomycetota bacterium]